MVTLNGRSRLTPVGAGVALIGLAVAVVYVFQPWRSCPEDDVAAGCAMLPQDATVMMIGFGVFLVGSLISVIGLGLGRTRARK